LSSDPSQASVIGTANRLLYVIMPVAALAYGLLGVFSGPALIVAFSPHFLPAQAVMPFLTISEYLQVSIWVLGAPLLARSRVAAWLSLDLGITALRTAVSLLLIPRFGLTPLAAR